MREGGREIWEGDLGGRFARKAGPNSILDGGFFFSRNTSNNSEVFQYQFENIRSLLKRAATVYERAICFGDSKLEVTVANWT